MYSRSRSKIQEQLSTKRNYSTCCGTLEWRLAFCAVHVTESFAVSAEIWKVASFVVSQAQEWNTTEVKLNRCNLWACPVTLMSSDKTEVVGYLPCLWQLCTGREKEGGVSWITCLAREWSVIYNILMCGVGLGKELSYLWNILCQQDVQKRMLNQRMSADGNVSQMAILIVIKSCGRILCWYWMQQKLERQQCVHAIYIYIYLSISIYLYIYHDNAIINFVLTKPSKSKKWTVCIISPYSQAVFAVLTVKT